MRKDLSFGGSNPSPSACVLELERCESVEGK